MYIDFPFLSDTQKIIQIPIETKLIKGLPELKIIGIQGIKRLTLKEKLRTALKAQNIKLKKLRKVIHIKSQLPEGTNLRQADLQLIAMLLAEQNIIKIPEHLPIFFIAEVNLEGEALPILNEKELNYLLEVFPNTIFVTSKESTLVHPNLIKVANIPELTKLNYSSLQPFQETPSLFRAPPTTDILTFDDIENFHIPKQSLILALKMQGSLLISGASGSGKSLLYRTLPSLGIQQQNTIFLDPSITVREFKILLQSFTTEARKDLSPSINTSPLPHKVIILNELTDYKKSFLDYLKIFFDQLDSDFYPFKVSILASMNPCPCGNHEHTEKLCTCNPYQIKQFQNKLPFPILDRFDLIIDINSSHTSISGIQLPELTHLDALATLNKELSSKKKVLDKFAEYNLTLLKTEFSPSTRRIVKIEVLASLLANYKEEPEISEETINLAITLNSFILNKNL